MRISDWSSDVCSSDLIRPEVFQRRQHARLERIAEMLAGGILLQRRVDDIALDAGFVLGARPRVKRHLVGRAEQDGGIVPEYVLRAIAVVNVPVDDRNT